MEKAEKDGYDIGVAEIEETLKAKVSGVCKTYCLQVWNEALNQARVEASSALRRAENLYYPLAIWASGFSGSKVETAFKDSEPSKDVPAKVLPLLNSPSKEVQQADIVENEIEMAKEVPPEVTKPPVVPKDSLKEKGTSQSREIVLATFPIPTKDDSKGKGSTSSAAALEKSAKASSKDNPLPLQVVPRPHFVVVFFFFFFCQRFT